MALLPVGAAMQTLRKPDASALRVIGKLNGIASKRGFSSNHLFFSES
jgi:hypothetical protein